MLQHLRPAFVLIVLFTVLTGLIYPLAVTGIAQVALPYQANGSLIEKDGAVVGSALIGQWFKSDRYFRPRPSATTDTDPNDSTKTIDAPYNAANSSGSNLGPTSQKLADRVKGGVEAWQAMAGPGPVPADAVTTSASGLDPDISPENALAQVPSVAPEWEDPAGVPISAIIFGGRRASTVPLVLESMDWTHGVFMGATMGSETTAAASGAVGVLRRDPMAMLAFCGYNMGDYFAHWMKLGASADPSKLPKIFYVNWFRQDRNGKYLWPGFGENSRVLKWIFERCDGKVHAKDTPIGRTPEVADLDTSGLKLSVAGLEELLSVDLEGWLAEVPSIKEHFDHFGTRLPEALREELKGLEERLAAAKK